VLQDEAAIGLNLNAISRTGGPITRGSRAPFTERGVLRLFVRGDSFFTNVRDSIAALASRVDTSSSVAASYFRWVGARRHSSRRPFGTSFVLHCSFIALLIYLPSALPAKRPSALLSQSSSEIIYYRVPLLDSARLPSLAPAGTGGRPGTGTIQYRLRALGSTVLHPNMTIVSKPLRPDNARQTIYQPSSPPDLKITAELKLPNIVLGHSPEKPKGPAISGLSKPNPANLQVAAIAAPTVNSNQASPLMTSLAPSQTQPRLPIPLLGGGAPTRPSSDGKGNVSAETAGDAPDLMVLGIEPSSSANVLSLPGGNRWGEFSISPHGGMPGSPGGEPSGVVGGGTGNGMAGGDASTGVGSNGKGGGGNLAGSAPVSVASSSTTREPIGGVDSLLASGMVYALKAPIVPRRNSLVISSGPIGGGSLSVYGALKCGKIYSIFLAMPGKNWSLQYCDKSAKTEKVVSDSGTSVVRMDKPLISPDFDAASRFDFKRTSVPVEKSHRSIILKGVIAVDGAVQQLIVYQGVEPEMDEAARDAFSRWHFKPAMKDGKPVEVEILVGIPPMAEEDRVNR